MGIFNGGDIKVVMNKAYILGIKKCTEQQLR